MPLRKSHDHSVVTSHQNKNSVQGEDSAKPKRLTFYLQIYLYLYHTKWSLYNEWTRERNTWMVSGVLSGTGTADRRNTELFSLFWFKLSTSCEAWAISRPILRQNPIKFDYKPPSFVHCIRQTPGFLSHPRVWVLGDWNFGLERGPWIDGNSGYDLTKLRPETDSDWLAVCIAWPGQSCIIICLIHLCLGSTHST